MSTTEEFSSVGPPAKPGRGQTEDRVGGVERDWLGRYILPQLDGTAGPVSSAGTRYGMTRASTVKSALVNKDGIRRWRERLQAEALAKSPQLMSELIKVVAGGDKKAIGDFMERAFVAGGGKEKADRGTAVHEVTERIKRGETVNPEELPAEHRREVSAYLQLLAEQNVRPVAGMQERIVKCLYGAAGTFDDMVRWFNPDTEEWELLIADLKTGRDLSLGWLEILIQLWLYANAEAIWNPPTDPGTGGYYSPMPTDLRRDRALIFHVPMDGTAELYVLDLSGVQAYVEASVVARRANSEAKHQVRSAGRVDLREATFTVATPIDQAARGQSPISQAITELIPADTVAPPAHIGEIDTGTLDRLPGIACGPVAPTAADIATAQEFAQQLANKPARTVHQDPSAAAFNPPSAFMGVPPSPADFPAEPPMAEMFPGQVTPQMIADQAAADARRAVGGIELRAPAEPLLNGEGKPLAPLAGPGKKGCGKCHRTGHRQTSKACLGDADPSLAPAVDRSVQTFDSDANMVANGDVSQIIERMVNQAIPPQYHNELDHSASWTPSGVPEQWVCAYCKLPSEMAEQQRLARLAGQPLNPETLPVLETAPPGMAYELPPHPRWQQLLDRCKTQAEVIDLRNALIGKSQLTAEIDDALKQRYDSLITPWGQG